MISFSQRVSITLIYYIMWYPDYQNKKLNLCMLNSFKGFHLCSKSAIMWYPDNQRRKKLNLCMLLQSNKNMFARIK